MVETLIRTWFSGAPRWR